MRDEDSGTFLAIPRLRDETQPHPHFRRDPRSEGDRKGAVAERSLRSRRAGGAGRKLEKLARLGHFEIVEKTEAP
jgi:hypothetical protein